MLRVDLLPSFKCTGKMVKNLTLNNFQFLLPKTDLQIQSRPDLCLHQNVKPLKPLNMIRVIVISLLL